MPSRSSARIFFGKTILQQQTREQTAQRTTADYVLRARCAQGYRRTPRPRHGACRALLRRPARSPTSVIVAADGTNLRSFPARAVDASTLAGVIDLGVTSGSLADLDGRPSRSAPTARSCSAGTPATRQRPARRRHAGHVARRRDLRRPLGFGDIVLPRSLAERHVTHPSTTPSSSGAIQGLTGETLAAGLERLARANPAIEVATRTQYEQRLEDAARRQSLAVYVLLGLIVVFCALALVNAVTMSTAERAREFALLRLVGAGKGQVRTMIRAETLIMVAFGLTIGTLIAVPGLAVFSHEPHRLGRSPPCPSGLYGGLVAFYTMLGFAAGVVPTRLALRVDPVKAMAARE